MVKVVRDLLVVLGKLENFLISLLVFHIGLTVQIFRFHVADAFWERAVYYE